MSIIVRKATIDDADSITENVLAMATEGSNTQLDSDVVTAGVRGLFERTPLGFYVVAEIDHENAGSLVIVNEWSDWRNGCHWWIHSVYVRPEHRRKGVYRAMHSWVVDEVRNTPSAVSLRLSVHKDNQGARSTYEEMGMIESAQVQYNQPDL